MWRLLCAIGLVLVLPLLVRSALPQQSQLALVGGTIYVSPSDPPIVDGVLLIRDRKISAVGPRRAVQVPGGTPTLDCTGLIITAGFWNSHVHFIERKWANARNIPADELQVQLQRCSPGLV